MSKYKEFLQINEVRNLIVEWTKILNKNEEIQIAKKVYMERCLTSFKNMKLQTKSYFLPPNERKLESMLTCSFEMGANCLLSYTVEEVIL